jgi:ribosomal protein L31
MRKTLVIIILLSLSITTFTQTVYHSTNNVSIYSFIDEMANVGLIEVISVVKPYSRMFIAQKLAGLDTIRSQLNDRQQKELDFFLKDFNKELKPNKNFNKRFDIFYYKDSLFTFSGNLTLGADFFANKNGNALYWWNGGEVFSYVGKYLGVYASLRDQHDRDFLTTPLYLNQRTGMRHKGNGDFEEMLGGITLTWKWGSIGLLKDQQQWGNNYYGANILSGRTPSIAKITLNLKPVRWFELNYLHGWLVSEVVDSNRSYFVTNSYGTNYIKVYHQKYIAANMFTFTPIRNLNISVGNSIIYADIGVHPVYLIPVLFYKGVDHTLKAESHNMNSQMYMDISSRNLRHLHLYGTIFVDEVNIGNMFDSSAQSNFFSWKLGGRLSDYPLQNISITAEYTRTNPLTFRHYLPTTTFESNKYNLGHYLTDNTQEVYLNLQYKPIRGLVLDLSWIYALKGPDYTELGGTRKGLLFIETVEWKNNTIAFKGRYEIINDGYVYVGFEHSNISGDTVYIDKYTHPMWHGKNNTVEVGINFGF